MVLYNILLFCLVVFTKLMLPYEVQIVAGPSFVIINFTITFQISLSIHTPKSFSHVVSSSFTVCPVWLVIVYIEVYRRFRQQVKTYLPLLSNI